MAHRISTGERTARGASIGAALTLTTALALGLAGCAPDAGPGPANDSGSKTPSTTKDPAADPDGGSKGSGAADGKPGASDEESWPERDPEGGTPKQTEIPPSFPSGSFAMPPGAVIDDAGERSSTRWFVVLRAGDAAAADAQWQAVIDANGFAVADTAETPEGGVSARLSSAGLTVDALTLPQPDGSVLLSYDLSAVG
ncbi:hypothetical protein [Leucobacter sp. wl10]|uniref:hypothetical protein n=1 Tax=Leucobacter sp. wl10 TaxID=2304677 RepID=UPI0013C3743C|nr:hypothetical protein [Leucobacter sp. wl10]